MVTHNPDYREKRVRKTIDCFKGLNKNTSAGEGYFTEAENFCSDYYPGVKTIGNKYLYETAYPLTGEVTIGGTDKLFYTCDEGFIYDNTRYLGITKGKKTLAVLGESVAIFPDKYCFFKTTEYYFYSESSGMRKTTPYSTVNDSVPLRAVSSSVPYVGKEGEKYYNTNTRLIYTYENGAWTNGTVPDTATIYSVSYTEFDKMRARFNWYFQSTGAARIETVGYDGDSTKNDLLRLTFYRNNQESNVNFDRFGIGDHVRVFGLSPEDLKYQAKLEALSAGTEIAGYGYGYILFKNNVGIDIIDTYLGPETEAIIIESVIPSLDCAVCVGDRIWGARDNIIYACSPGNIHSWGSGNDYDTHVSLKSEASGKIIGCADLGGTPVFFNENSVTKVTRVYNGYRLYTVPAPSLSKSNPESIACVGGNLYYLSDCGVMCYNGTTFKKIESNFDDVFTDCKAGTDGSKYYLASPASTYIYDPESKVWYTDSTKYAGFARFGPYFAGLVSESSGLSVNLINNCGELGLDKTTGSERCLVFTPFDEGTHETKYYSKLIFKTSSSAASLINIEVSYDGNEFEDKGTIVSRGTQATISVLELKPQPCKTMQIRLRSPADENYTIISVTREYAIHENKK